MALPAAAGVPYMGLGMLGLGGNILGGIGDYLGGGQDRKMQEIMMRGMQQRQQQSGQLWGQLQGQLNNPQQFLSMLQKALAPQMNQIAGRASRRLGLDSGAAQGELARSQQGGLAQGFLNQQQTLQQLLASLAR